MTNAPRMGLCGFHSVCDATEPVGGSPGMGKHTQDEPKEGG